MSTMERNEKSFLSQSQYNTISVLEEMVVPAWRAEPLGMFVSDMHRLQEAVAANFVPSHELYRGG